MELLLRKGASINVVNKARCSALHVAVNKQHAACVKVLVKYGCDVNVQVSGGVLGVAVMMKERWRNTHKHTGQ